MLTEFKDQVREKEAYYLRRKRKEDLGIMKNLRETLIEDHGLIEEQADFCIEEAKMALLGYIESGDNYSAENVCMEYFGLELDYLIDLM